MEVKSVYMDLQEGVKKGNVWKLESEAFKKPIEIKIGYDNNDKKYIENIRDEIQAKSDNYDRKLNELNQQLEEEKKWNKGYDNMLCRYESAIETYEKKLSEKDDEVRELYKVVADLKTTVETLSGTILHLQGQVKELEKKTTKQPSVFHDKSFISGRESCGLGVFELQDGDYLMILKTIVGECNEYVVNQDDIVFDKIHVEGQHYIPFYKLEGGTELDTPTATIYYDLIFMPI